MHRNNLGNVRFWRHDYEASLRDYDVVIEMEPENAVFHANRANALHALGRREEALGGYQRVMELDPQDSRWPHAVGIIEEERGDLEEARRWYEAAVAKAGGQDPNLAIYCGNLAEILRRQGRLGEAEDAIRKSLALKPGEPGFQAKLNQIREERRAAGDPDAPAVAPLEEG